MRAKLECEQTRSLIDASLDDELDANNRMMFEEHLVSCPECTNAHVARRDFLSRVRTQANRFTAPDSLRARLLAELPQRTESNSRHPGLWRWLTGGAWFASAAALAASLALFLSLPGQQDELTRGLVAAHVRSLMPDHLTDVPSSDRHTVKPWFNGKVGLSPPVPNLAEKGYPLVGGRLDYVDDHTAAALVYRRSQHVINLFVWAAPGTSTSAPMHAAHNGYNLVEWSNDGLRFAAVSDVALTDLTDFQRLWTTAATDGGSENNAP
jgi:anti-sigma factor RsiW